jgi:putative hemolysin
MGSFGINLFLILLLILANGIFSGSEIALVSSRKVRLEQRLRQGQRGARQALKLANAPNRFLSTVQIGITLIGILTGALGGATLAQRLELALATIPALEPYSQVLSLAIVVSLITYVSLVIGELVPKRVALSAPERIACAVAVPMSRLSQLVLPLVHLLSLSTEGVIRLLGIHNDTEPTVTEEEIKVLLEQGTQAGMFEVAEQDMVARIFRLGDRPIKAFMTPRTEIDWLDINAPLEENRHIILASSHSRFPVCQNSIDNCLGFVRLRNLLDLYLSGHDVDLRSLLQDPLNVAEGTRALKVLELFKETGTHMALVIDEYGGLEGIVTLNDLVEAIVGDLPMFDDQEEPLVVQREDGSWLIDGSLSTDELKTLLQRDILPQEDAGTYHTLAGFVITHLGRIPTSGDAFEWDGWRFEVVDMDGNRVDKLLVAPTNSPSRA